MDSLLRTYKRLLDEFYDSPPSVVQAVLKCKKDQHKELRGCEPRCLELYELRQQEWHRARQSFIPGGFPLTSLTEEFADGPSGSVDALSAAVKGSKSMWYSPCCLLSCASSLP